MQKLKTETLKPESARRTGAEQKLKRGPAEAGTPNGAKRKAETPIATPHLACGHLLPDRGGEGACSERMLTKEEVATYLGLKPNTVARMANDGRLRVHRVGRRLRFLLPEVREAFPGATKAGGDHE